MDDADRKRLRDIFDGLAKSAPATLTGRSRPHADGSVEWEAECDDGEMRWFSDRDWPKPRVMKVTLPDEVARKPHPGWVKDGNAMSLTAGVFSISAWWVGTKHRWRILSNGGDNFHDSGTASSLEEPQLAAQQALESLLSEALAEVRGDRCSR